MRQLTVITGNVKKLNEIIRIIGADSPFQIVHRKIDLPEYQGELEFIVRQKCKHAAKLVDGPVLVEDTSLSIDALGGLPGPYIKWFVDKIGPSGLDRMLAGWPDNRRATAICKLAFCENRTSSDHDDDDDDIRVFTGAIDGRIVAPRGDNQFGWDPCFEPIGHERTFAQMDIAVKNSISHRYLAVCALREYLIQLKK